MPDRCSKHTSLTFLKLLCRQTKTIVPWILLLQISTAHANMQAESLEDLMNTEIKIASPIASPIRRAPGVISIFDRPAIEASGATTLQEFIALIPGFHIAADTAQTIGLGFRGLWGHEGKILVLVDGFEYNDLAYNTFIVGARFPLSMIEKIEVVRGPGSVVHGGNAELAVISITTLALAGEPGIRMRAAGGTMPRASFSRGTLAVGSRSPRVLTDTGSSIESGILAYGIHSTVSDKEYNSLDGETADLKDAALFAPRGAIAHLRWQSWKTKFAYEDLETRQVANYGTPANPPVNIRHRQFQMGLGREWNFESSQLKASFGFNEQSPWNSTNIDTVSNGSFYDKIFRRLDAALEASYSNAAHSISYGVKYRDDVGKVLSDGGQSSYQFFGNSSPSLELRQNWTTLYAEYAHVSDDSSFVVGARHEIPSRVATSTVPRMAYTHTFDTTTFKAMASAAYRTPGAENLSLNQDIKPEKTQTYEIELSETLSANSLISLNLFSIRISDPIVYTNLPSGTGTADQYRNFDRTGSNGAELSFQWHSSSLRAATSLAYATTADMNNVTQYAVTGDSHLLAFPTLRATGFLQSKLGPLKLGGNISWESVRHGWIWNSNTATAEVRDFDSTVLLGLNAIYQFEDIRGFSIEIAGTNLLNQERAYILPFKGETSKLGHMPGPSREWMLGVDYVVSF
ncbi:MAG: TonB-dependent receptor [Bdellovibrionales bacterium]|nr:TonB-dependent receptor [Bdellovibrionales bacterium]